MNTHDTTSQNTTPDRSLRFWMRAAHSAFGAELARVLADEGLDRRDWGVLNVLTGERSMPGLDERVQRGGKRVRALAARGWATEADGRWVATEDGRRERDRIHGLVSEVRGRASGAVSDADFATTVASLEKIARALGWDENAPRACGPRGRHGFGPGRGFGHRFGGFGGFRAGFGPEHGAHRGEHPHGEHPRHRGERAFERGFTAGFQAGRDAA
ncbi:MarR family winged helix-turn-helix transcriptional regulator [Microbacterium sp. cf332]|uniref:MarR family winged helix-turn-helix transcriptional regulator n=1 Tax=Microbacterium sp. cf332 TaxID=1761804 RepID=UPI00089046E6|nr:hypothetical protein [Microbacterium sp. cf332]SDQ65122.1 hypothetical protein SAMN04487847_2229 [Microbacterium sp. cf332]